MQAPVSSKAKKGRNIVNNVLTLDTFWKFQYGCQCANDEITKGTGEICFWIVVFAPGHERAWFMSVY